MKVYILLEEKKEELLEFLKKEDCKLINFEGIEWASKEGSLEEIDEYLMNIYSLINKEFHFLFIKDSTFKPMICCYNGK